MALRLERLLQVRKVIDLAVENDGLAARRVDHRLVGGGRKIQNRKAAMGKQASRAVGIGLRGGPLIMSVRTTMYEGAGHPRKRRAIRVVDPSQDSGDAAHDRSLRV